MAGDWLKLEASTPDKPEVLAITATMGWDDPDLTVGKLFRVWRWFDQQTTDGNAFGVTAALLDRIAGVSGFAQAMQKVGWLIVSGEGLKLPNFEKHNGATAKSRSETAKRVANHRAKKGEPAEPGHYQRLSIPRPIRAAVLARDGNACVYCNRKQGEYAPTETARDGYLHIDHVIPLTNGGTDDISNLATACAVCNMFKSDRTPEECGLDWPEHNGKRLGNSKTVTPALAREEKRREEKEEKKPPAAPWLTVPELVADGLSQNIATDWLAHRRTRKAKLTRLAWEGFKTEVQRAGWALDDAVRKAIARNWTAFEADWVKPATGPPSVAAVTVPSLAAQKTAELLRAHEEHRAEVARQRALRKEAA